MPNRVRILLLAIAGACLIAACDAGPRRVSGQPPQAGIDSLTREDGSVVVEVRLRNVNDQPLDIGTVALDMKLDEQPFARGSSTVSLTVAPRGREVIRMQLSARDDGLARLDGLDSGEQPAVRWELELVLTDPDGRERTTSDRGWLHPVPGQPGRYR